MAAAAISENDLDVWIDYRFVPHGIDVFDPQPRRDRIKARSVRFAQRKLVVDANDVSRRKRGVSPLLEVRRLWRQIPETPGSARQKQARAPPRSPCSSRCA